MPDGFEPKTKILPKAQQEIGPLLAPTRGLSFVLYGGTAVAGLTRRSSGHKAQGDYGSAEAKDYRDIAVMLSAGISLEKALGAFAKMYGKDPGLPLRAIGFFKDAIWLRFPKAIRMFCETREIAFPKFLKSQ
jgi:hypothetical protein